MEFDTYGAGGGYKGVELYERRLIRFRWRCLSSLDFFRLAFAGFLEYGLVPRRLLNPLWLLRFLRLRVGAAWKVRA